ncbi:MAG: cytochrome P450, partial [Acidimicrobiia bacterium]
TYDDLMGAFVTLHQMATELGEQRRQNPTEDLTSVLMHAEVDGERLTVTEFASFFILMVVAGNETTRTAISHGMLALHENPDQRALWSGDFDEHAQNAVEEIVRWATPVVHFRRTATADTDVNGFPIKEGDKLVMWFNSANRDERAFDDPFRFDIRRYPNAHFGFGGGGPHFCLGANLARREIRVMFEELFRRLPDLEITAEPARLQSSFIHGIKRMPCRWTPAG